MESGQERMSPEPEPEPQLEASAAQADSPPAVRTESLKLGTSATKAVLECPRSTSASRTAEIEAQDSDSPTAAEQLYYAAHGTWPPSIPAQRRKMLHLSATRGGVDYDAAGQLMQSRLGGGRLVQNMDVIWTAPGGDSKVFVGNLQAAQDTDELRRNSITHVVNCMNRSGVNKQSGIEYFNFHVERWNRIVASKQQIGSSRASSRSEPFVPSAASAASAVEFFEPVWRFIREAVDGGGSVLIHCFAGMHRAGTTAVSFLMHMSPGLRASEAITRAQEYRPVIDPRGHGDLITLLEQLDIGMNGSKSSAVRVAEPAATG